MVEFSKWKVVVITGVLLIGGVGLFPSVGQAEDDSSVQFRVESAGEAEPGDETTVRIDVSTDQHSLYGVQYTLDYDSSAINAVSVSKGSFLSQNASSIVITKQVNEDEGQIEYGESRIGTENGVTGEGTITELTLTIDGNAREQSVPLELVNVQASDPNASSLPTTTTNATIQITAEDNSSPTPEPTETPSGGSSTPIATPISQTPGTGTPASNLGSSINWESKLTDRVRDALADSGTSPIIVTIHEDEDLSVAAEALKNNGASDVTHLESVHAVSAVAPKSAVEAVAKLKTVKAIRYDSRVTAATVQTKPTATPSGPAETIKPTDKETPPSETTSQSSPTPTEAPSVFGPGFGPITSLIALLAMLVWVVRRNRALFR